MKLKNLIFIASLTMALGLCACSYIPSIVEVSVPESEIQLELGVPQTIPVSCVTEEQQEDFSAPFLSSVAPADVTFEFSSSDSDTVMVDADGKAVGMVPGEAEITVKASNSVSEKTAKIKVSCFEYQQDLSAIPETIEMRLGEEYDLAALYSDYIRWNALIKSQDDEVVEINGTKLVSQRPGDTTISLTLGSEQKDIAFHSIEMVTEYALNFEELEGYAGDEATLSVGEYLPETANGGLTLTYTSSDEEIVTVDADGTVHFAAPGEAVITTVNESGIEAECMVTVTEKPAATSQASTGYGSTNPADFDTSNPAVAKALSMVGQKRKCTEITEAVANLKGKTGWVSFPVTIGGHEGIQSELTPEGFLNLGRKVSADQIQPGDILYYADGGWGISHVAVYIGDGMAVHGNFTTDGITKIASAFYTTVTHIIHID